MYAAMCNSSISARTQKRSKKTDNIFYLLFLLCGFEAIFLNDISSSVFHRIRIVSLADEILPVLIVILAFATKRKLNTKLNFNNVVKAFMLFSIYVSIISLPQILENPHLGGFVFIFKILSFFLLLYLLASFETLTNRPYEKYIRYLLKLGVIYAFFNTIFYFVPLPIWDENTSRLLYASTVGRITCGYAPTDSVIISFLLILVLYNDFGFKYKTRIFITVVYIIEILIMASGTGVITLVTVICLYWLFCLKASKKLFVVLLSVVLPFCLYKTVSRILMQEPELVGTMELIEHRINSLLSPSKVSDYNTLEIREDEYKAAKKFVDNNLQVLFGIGFGRYTNKMEYVNFNKTVFIENQFDSLIISYGFIGLGLYILLFIKWGIVKIKNNRNKFLHYSVLIAFLYNSYTATPLYGFQEIMIFTVLLSYSHKVINDENKNIILVLKH